MADAQMTTRAAETVKKRRAAALAFFEQTGELMQTLYARWEDEAEYEDIADYAKPITPLAEKFGVKIIQMTSAPFGMRWSLDGVVYQTAVNDGTYGYRRIA